jgi:hypothetical protein
MSAGPSKVIDTATNTHAASIGNAKAIERFNNQTENAYKLDYTLSPHDEALLMRTLKGKYVEFSHKKTYFGGHGVVMSQRALLRQVFEREHPIAETYRKVLVVGSTAVDFKKYMDNPNFHFQFAMTEVKDLCRVVETLIETVERGLKRARVSPAQAAIRSLDVTHPDLLHRTITERLTKADKEVLRQNNLDIGGFRKRVNLYTYRGLLKYVAAKFIYNNPAVDTNAVIDPENRLPSLFNNRLHFGTVIPREHFDVILLPDSCYNFDEQWWVDLFDRTTAHVAYAYGLFPYELIFNGMPAVEVGYYTYSETRELPPEEKNPLAKRVYSEVTFTDGESGYKHLKENWSLLMRKEVLLGRLHSEKVTSVGAMQLFRISPIPPHVSHPLVRRWNLPDRYHYINILDCDAFWDGARQRVKTRKFKYFPVFRDEYMQILEYVAVMKHEEFDVRLGFMFVRSRCAGFVMGSHVQEGWLIPKNQQLKVAMTAMLHALCIRQDSQSLFDYIKKNRGKVSRDLIPGFGLRDMVTAWHALVDWFLGQEVRPQFTLEMDSSITQRMNVVRDESRKRQLHITLSDNKYPDALDFSRMGTSPEAQRLLAERLGSLTDYTVFDFFAGVGNDSDFFKELGANVYVAEIDPARRGLLLERGYPHNKIFTDFDALWQFTASVPLDARTTIAYFDPPFEQWVGGWEKYVELWRGPILAKIPADFNFNPTKITSIHVLEVASNVVEYKFAFINFDVFESNHPVEGGPMNCDPSEFLAPALSRAREMERRAIMASQTRCRPHVPVDNNLSGDDDDDDVKGRAPPPPMYAPASIPGVHRAKRNAPSAPQEQPPSYAEACNDGAAPPAADSPSAAAVAPDMAPAAESPEKVEPAAQVSVERVTVAKQTPEGISAPACQICSYLAGRLGKQNVRCNGCEPSRVDLEISAEQLAKAEAKVGLDEHGDPIDSKTLDGAKEYMKECINGGGARVRNVKIDYVHGGPGTGKTTMIMAMLKPGDGILVPFRALAKEYGRKCKDLSVYIKTQHRFLAERKDGSVTGTLYVDEFTSMPYEYVVLAASCYGVKHVVFVGDFKQTNTRESEGIPIRKALKEHLDAGRVHILCRNFRNPGNIVRGIARMFGYPHMVSDKPDSPVKVFETFAEVHDDGLDPFGGEVQILTFTKNAAEEIKDYGPMTVRSSQGMTFKNVIIYARGKHHDHYLASKPEFQLVAYTRHTDKLYVVVDQSDVGDYLRGLTKNISEEQMLEANKDFTGRPVPLMPRVREEKLPPTQPYEPVLPPAPGLPMEDLADVHRVTTIDNLHGSLAPTFDVKQRPLKMRPDPYMIPNSKGTDVVKPKLVRQFGAGLGNLFEGQQPGTVIRSVIVRYANVSSSKTLTCEGLDLAKHIAQNFYEQCMTSYQDLDIFEVSRLYHEYFDRLSEQNQQKSFAAVELHDPRRVKFFLKQQFKVYLKTMKPEKGGQGIAAWNPQAAAKFRLAFRMWQELFEKLLKKNVMTEHGKTAHEVINRAQQLLKVDPVSGVSLNGAPQVYLDMEEFDKNQNGFTMAIEAYILEATGWDPEMIDAYFFYRKGAPMNVSVEGQPLCRVKTDTEKMSGEPGTLAMNTLVAGAIATYITPCPSGSFCMLMKGDDVVRKGNGLDFDKNFYGRMREHSNLVVKVIFDDVLDWCGYSIFGGYFVPSLPRLAWKTYSHGIRDADHWEQFKDSLRDRYTALLRTSEQVKNQPQGWWRLQIARLQVETKDFSPRPNQRQLEITVNSFHRFIVWAMKLSYDEFVKESNKRKTPLMMLRKVDKELPANRNNLMVQYLSEFELGFPNRVH